MAIQVKCDCGEILRIPRPAPGEAWKCPSCGATIQAPVHGKESADALEIPIEGSAIGPRQAAPSVRTSAVSSGEGDLGKEDLEDQLEEPEDSWEEHEGPSSGIPKGMLWGVFLVLLGLLGMIFLLKPGIRQETAGPGPEPPKAEAPAPVGEEASVRVALQPGVGEGAQASMAVPPTGGGPTSGQETPAGVGPQAPPVPGPAISPQPEALPGAPSPQAQEPAAKPAIPSAAPSAGSAGLAPAAPQRAAAPSKPEKLAQTRQPSAKPSAAYTLNVGSFKARKNAEALRQELEQKGIEATVMEVRLPDKGTWYRVSVGRFSTPAAARRLAQELEKKWQIPSFVAQLD